MGDAPALALAHSFIGASSMGRLIACPGSFTLSQQARAAGVAREGNSIWAATGTVAHALAEKVLAGADVSQLPEIGSVVWQAGHMVEITDDLTEAVDLYVKEVRARGRGADRVWLEQRVCLDAYWPAGRTPYVSAFGTADALIYHRDKRHLDVIDYKNGAGVFVGVEDSPQLLYYAAGGLFMLAADPGDNPVDTVELTIVQPNARGQEDARKVRSQLVAAVDVLLWVHDTLKPTVERALYGDPKALHAGRHCQFCAASRVCSAKREADNGKRLDAARIEFGG